MGRSGGAVPLLLGDSVTFAAVLRSRGMCGGRADKRRGCLRGAQVLGSIGDPIGDTEVKVVDPETGRALAPGVKGVVKARGPQVMKGYLKASPHTLMSTAAAWHQALSLCPLNQ